MSAPIRGHLLVVAKEPAPGRVKTRLCPPLSETLAAAVAEAALRDTLAAVGRCRAGQRIVALDGQPGPWLPGGFEVVPQAGGDLADRLEDVWARAGAPGLQIGMDTPQVTPRLLDESLARLAEPGVDAVLGPAADGGWWAVGFARPVPGAFRGIPMSTDRTYDHQLARLRSMGLRVHRLPQLRDLDTVADAIAIARDHPESDTARTVRGALVAVGFPRTRRSPAARPVEGSPVGKETAG